MSIGIRHLELYGSAWRIKTSRGAALLMPRSWKGVASLLDRAVMPEKVGLGTRTGALVYCFRALMVRDLRRSTLGSLCMLLLVQSSNAQNYPAPQCLPIVTSNISPQLEFFEGSMFPSGLALSARRNAEYLLEKLAAVDSGSSLAQAYVLNFGPVSIFFPAKECPNGCTAYLVRNDEHVRLIRPISFFSHMIIVSHPMFSWVFLAEDGNRFVEIRSSKAGVEVHEWSELPMRLYPSLAKSCLVSGAFGKLAPASNEDRQ